ncbi:MAG: efflux RND transporter periplasmic adaptor subunit [Acidobacteriota bacterium]
MITARHRSLLTFGIVLSAMGFGVVGCSRSLTQQDTSAAAPADTTNIPVVEAVQARYGSVPLSERLNGTVIAQNQVVLYSEISGRIMRVQARNGDLVQQGDPLVYLQDAQYREQLGQAEANFRVNQAALKQAQAQLAELEAQYRAIKVLAEEGLSSRLEVETLAAQIASAKARIELTEAQIQESKSAIEEARAVLSRTVIRAPITGTIGERNAEVGMQVSSGTRLFTIGDLDRLRVEVIFTEEMLDTVEVGQPVRIEAGSQGVEARLTRISPFLDPVTRTTKGEVDIRNVGSLRPGMSITVEVLHGRSRQATLIPTSALYTNPSTGRDGTYLLLSFSADPHGDRQASTPSGENSLPPTSKPTPVKFVSIEVIAEGRMEVAVDGIDPGQWVVSVGQDLIAAGKGQAHVRASSWERVLRLQGLQREDLLREILETE